MLLQTVWMGNARLSIEGLEPMEIARWIITFVAIVTAFGGLMADYFVPFGAKQHLKNPLWKPHAKFHNAQGILMGLLQGVLAVAVLFVLPVNLGTILLAAIIASLYWVALMAAPVFPETAWVDPEFEAEVGKPLGLHPQQLIGYILLVLLLAAIAIAFLNR